MNGQVDETSSADVVGDKLGRRLDGVQEQGQIAADLGAQTKLFVEHVADGDVSTILARWERSR